MPKTVYICEYCRRQYNTQLAALECEKQHDVMNDYQKRNHIKLINIISKDLCPCDYCKHAYYVYGTEWNCDCYKNCNNYNLFTIEKI